MMLPYSVRLVCLCLACLGLVQLVVGLGVAALAGWAIRMSGRLGASGAARWLLAVRLLPAGAGVFAMLGLCLPSYLWLEEEAAGEPVSGLCLLAAMLGASILAIGVGRAARAVMHSPRTGRPALRIEGEECWVIDSPWPVFALTGVFRSRLCLSAAALEALPANELAVAVDHERAHRASRDNLKRLLLRLAPFPFPALDRAWSKYAEWAADDAAAMGDAERSLELASALVRIARLRAQPRAYPLASCLLAEEHDLAARVERLLAGPGPCASGRSAMFPLAAATGLAALLINPASLAVVHNLLETLMH
jgi:Zn-dependent protease with chaperone function